MRDSPTLKLQTLNLKLSGPSEVIPCAKRHYAIRSVRLASIGRRSGQAPKVIVHGEYVWFIDDYKLIRSDVYERHGINELGSVY